MAGCVRHVVVQKAPRSVSLKTAYQCVCLSPCDEVVPLPKEPQAATKGGLRRTTLYERACRDYSPP
jgi:hypothetical protein